MFLLLYVTQVQNADTRLTNIFNVLVSDIQAQHQDLNSLFIKFIYLSINSNRYLIYFR